MAADTLPNMDADSVAGINAKLDRADEHMKALEDEIGVYVDSYPYDYALEIDPDGGRYSVRVTIKAPPPIRLAIICGDFIHNLRSTLEYGICALVPAITTSTQFPICKASSGFQSIVTAAKRNRPGALTGLNPTGKLFAYVEKAQPYNGAHGIDSHPLWLLAQLSNADKHRAILTTAGSHTPSTDLRIGGDDIEFIGKAELIYDQPLVDRAEVVRGQFEPTPGHKPDLYVYGRIPIDIAFGDQLVPSKSLPELVKAVREVVDSLVTLSAAGST
jgi:hypothetical protein